jgi:hypothetical protein
VGRIADIRYLADQVGLQIADTTIEAIAASTPNDIDLDAILNDLRLKEKVTAGTLKKAIQNAPKPPQEHCGQCRDGFIHALDVHTLREMNQNDVLITNPIRLPKAKAYCPNCGIKKEWTIRKVNGSFGEDAGWQWVVLYSFAIFQLQHSTPYDKFNPQAIWPAIDLNPELSNQQLSILHMIQDAAKHRIPIIENPIPEIINQAVAQAAIPF